jgi:hypothetical protein
MSFFKENARREANQLRAKQEPSLFGITTKIVDQMGQLMEPPISYREVLMRQIKLTNIEALEIWKKWEGMMERYRTLIPTSRDAVEMERRMERLIKKTQKMNREIDDLIARVSAI